MRREFSDTIEKLAKDNENLVFITGDLGYNAFENLQIKLGERFINSGVAEQSMIGIAAGLAVKGYKVFCYSIAPFIVYRCLEQIRNDVCFHNLPVFMVGNGGGYGYGIMGSSHHAISDLASISSLPNIKSWIPNTANDVNQITERIFYDSKPAYLRLGRSSLSLKCNDLNYSFNIIENNNSSTTIIGLGPMLEKIILATRRKKLNKLLNIMGCFKLPLVENGAIIKILESTKNLIIVEDHVEVGGLSQQISSFILKNKIIINNFINMSAKGYPSDLYGNEDFHHLDSKISIGDIEENILRILN